MAMKVIFKAGNSANLPASRDANTFYYVTDTFALYLGDHLISNEVTAEQFGALSQRVEALEGNTFQSQIDEINNTLKSIATSTEIAKKANKVEGAVVNGIAILNADGDLADSGKTIESLKADIRAAQKEFDDAQDKVIESKVAQSDYDTKIAAIEEDIATKATVADLDTAKGRLDTAETEIDELQTKITGLTGAMHFKGVVETLPTDFTDYVAGDVVLSGTKEYVCVENEGRKEWRELGDEGSHALKDITITGAGYLVGGGDLSENREIDVKEEVKVKIDQGAEAYSWGNHADVGYLTAAAIADMETQTHAAETYQVKGEYEEAGAAAKVQGETTETVRSCVDAINKLNNTFAVDKKEIDENIENVVAQLTWGSF